MASFADYLQAVKATIREISVHELKNLLESNPELHVLDVREPDEHQNGVIKGATLVPRGFLEPKIEGICPKRTTTLAIYCAGGTRSAMAAASSSASSRSFASSSAARCSPWLWGR